MAVLVFLSIIFVSIAPKFFIERAKKNKHAKTYMLQIKLYKAVVLQLWLSNLVGLVPILILLVSIWQKFPIDTGILSAMIALHGPMDLFVIG